MVQQQDPEGHARRNQCAFGMLWYGFVWFGYGFGWIWEGPKIDNQLIGLRLCDPNAPRGRGSIPQLAFQEDLILTRALSVVAICGSPNEVSRC